MALHPKILREKLTELLKREVETSSPTSSSSDEGTPSLLRVEPEPKCCEVADFEVLKAKLAEKFQQPAAPLSLSAARRKYQRRVQLAFLK